MFRKIVAIEPVSLVKEAEEELRTYAEEAVFYGDIPADDEEDRAPHRGCGRGAGELYLQNRPGGA